MPTMQMIEPTYLQVDACGRDGRPAAQGLRMMLDTGSESTVLPPRLMAALDIKPEMCEETEQSTAAGPKQGLKYKPGIDVIYEGNRIPVEPVFCDSNGLMREEALTLGTRDFMRAFRIDWDIRARTVTLERHSELDRPPFERVGSPMIDVEIRTSAGRVTELALLDTGAEWTTLPSRLMHPLGIDPTSCTPEGDVVVAPDSIPAGVRFAEWFAPIALGFNPHLRNPVLGRSDFLRWFRLELEMRSGRVELHGHPDTMRAGTQPRRSAVRRNTPKVGRNDPCWCGSGEKYKKCHGSPVADQ